MIRLNHRAGRAMSHGGGRDGGPNVTSLPHPHMVPWPASGPARPDPGVAAQIPPESRTREPILLLAALLTALVLSGIAPTYRLTWLLEEGPLFLGVPVLVA